MAGIFLFLFGDGAFRFSAKTRTGEDNFLIFMTFRDYLRIKTVSLKLRLRSSVRLSRDLVSTAKPQVVSL